MTGGGHPRRFFTLQEAQRVLAWEKRPKAEVLCVLRKVMEKSIAISTGIMQEHENPRTGEITAREKWVFLPRSQILIRTTGEPPERIDASDTEALEPLINTSVRVTVPKKIALREGLI